MASVAAALAEKGIRITGSDNNAYPPMSTFLTERGILPASGFSEENLSSEPDLVVIGNAISRGNPEAEYVLDRKLPYCSLPELLKATFLRGKRSIVVTGTHGKTTTTSLLAWVFERSGYDPSFLIGGLPKNFSGGARFTESEWFIIEGDEYDTAFFDKRSKFVHYLPEIGIINNIEFDHADVFENLGAIQTSFRHFMNLIPRNGLLLANGDDTNVIPLLDAAFCPIQRMGFGQEVEVRASDLRLSEGDSEFKVGGSKFILPLAGEFNVRNALGVVACARHCGLDDALIQSAFETFKGVQRRMEVKGTSGGVTVIDDFGHHPTAICETLRALRIRHPDQRLWAVFEPRSNTTRRKVFQQELAQAFSNADAIVIAQVARLELLDPTDRLNPERLIDDLRSMGKSAHYLPTVPAILDQLTASTKPGDIVCVFSNGGFENIHTRLLERLNDGQGNVS